MKRKTIIYLANLANTKFGCSPSTVPLEIGYIKAYAVSQLSDKIDVRLYRTFESLHKAICDRKPDIIGCSWYGWNRYITTNALRYIKSEFPDILIVAGGPNVPELPEDCLKDFKEFPCIDFMIPNEGEIPFVDLLKVFTEKGKEGVFKTAIEGIFYLSHSKGSEVIGRPATLAGDINIFPSPYLEGYLDEFLRTELMPVLQTMRGCPFHCSFCVSARDSWNKIRSFNTDRVKKEIDYLEVNAKNRIICITDENFGILPRDLDIARYIKEKREKNNYPSALRLYTHKDINDRIKEITLLLKDLIPMNISLQTLTGSVLDNINRKNIDLDKFCEAINWAHKNSINATTEIIFGLPGETYKSFMEVINKIVDLRLDSVAVAPLMMLKETEINRPESINKYGYKVLYSVAERGYTRVNQFENVEIDAWAIESNAFNFEEYIRVKLFIMIYHLFMFWGYFKEMVYMWENRGVKIAEVILELIDNHDAYPFFSQRIERLRKCIQDNLFKTKEEVRTIFSRRFSSGSAGQYIGFLEPVILSKIIKGEMIHSSNQEKTIDEVIRASTVIFNKYTMENLSQFLKEMAFAKALVKSIIIPFWEMPQEAAVLSSSYDLIAWRNNDYRGTLSEFTLSSPNEYQFKIRSLGQYSDFIHKNSDKPLYLQSEYFFRTFRSNNIRRFIVSEDSLKTEKQLTKQKEG